MRLELSEVGAVVGDKVGDDSRGCIMKGLREPLNVLGKGGVTLISSLLLCNIWHHEELGLFWV